tara:strand:+ start:1641 stop:2645 length:1005 start_codon:yes stop_codon:yes gene_type:complete
MPFIAILGLLFGLSSCGSYQYVGVDNDGIYGSSYPNNGYQETVVEVQNNPKTNNYYKNYFREKSLEYSGMANGEVFTDIDSYKNNTVENDSIDNNYQGYGGWGQNNSSVSINISPSYGFNSYWGYYPYDYWGYGYNSWGYYNPWYSPYYYGGFYGGYYNTWGYYNPYSYYNYGYGYPYYGGGYYGGYGRRGLSYSATRRGSLSSNYNTNLSNSRNSYSRTSNYSTSRRGSVNSNSNTVNRYNSSSPRVYTNSQRRSASVSSPTANSTNRSSSVGRSSRSSSSTNNRSYNTRRSSGNSSPSYSRPSSGSYSSGSRGGSSSSGSRGGSSSSGRRGR